ncbi:MAG: hypothetical protein ABII82_18160, partial [Verrucomicrobiota bacterium]
MHILQSRNLTPLQFWLRVGAVGTLILIGAVAWFGHKPIMRHYQAAKQQRALVQARDFLAQKDYNNTRLALKVAMQAIPGDPETMRVAAELLEEVGSPEAMPLRRRMLAVNPDSAADQVALINSALRFGDLNAASDALGAVPPGLINDPAVLKAGLAYAMATNNHPVADALFDRLKITEPENRNLEVMHALLRLHSPQPDVAAAARARLDELALLPRNTLFIQRELLRVALYRQSFPEASRLATLIAANPEATMNDRLNLANLRLNIDRESFADIFRDLAPLAEKSPEDTATLARWMLVIGQPQPAADWLDARPAGTGDERPVQAIRADLAAATEDWDTLGDLLEAGAWGPIPQDSLRLAFTARLVESSNNARLKPELWEEAVRITAKSQSGLNTLHRLARIWNWSDQIESTLWTMVRNFPSEAWAHETLFSRYRQSRDTEKIRELMETLKSLDGTVPRYKYDWALLSLLTQNRTTWTPAKQAMHDLYTADPDKAHYAVGYAFALAQSDMEQKGLEILEKLPPAELTHPTRAPYLAFIYGMNRQRERFETSAAVQPGLKDLLPEERGLFSLGRT